MVMLFDSSRETAKRPNCTPDSPILRPRGILTQRAPSDSPLS